MIIDGGLPADWHVYARHDPLAGGPESGSGDFAERDRIIASSLTRGTHPSPRLSSPSSPPLQACPQLVRVKCHRDRDAAPRGVVILGTALLINNANPPPAPPPLRLLLPAVVSRASRFPLSPPPSPPPSNIRYARR